MKNALRITIPIVAIWTSVAFAAEPLSDRAQDAQGSPAFEPPTGTVALPDALAAALRLSPNLPAASLELRAREAETLQAGYLPNPTLATEVEDFGGTGQRNGFNASQTTISLFQLIELGDKRAKRVRLAQTARDLSKWDYEALRIDVLTNVAVAFLDVLAAQLRLKLSDDLLNTAEQSLRNVAGSVRMGAVSPVEEGRARVALSQGTIERDRRTRELEQAKLSLARTWGSSVVTFAEVRGDLPTLLPPESLETFLSRIEGNPDLARWRTEIESRSAALSLEQAHAIPDVTVSAGGRYYQDEGDGGIVALFSVPLPAFDRNQGNIAAAQMRLARSQSDREATAISVRSTLAQTYQALLSAYQRATELRDRTLPDAEAVYAGARDAYARGLFRYIEVLDAQRTLFQLRGDYVDALADYHRALAAISRLTGDVPQTTEDERQAP